MKLSGWLSGKYSESGMLVYFWQGFSGWAGLLCTYKGME
jgi:hypothetical protein